MHNSHRSLVLGSILAVLSLFLSYELWSGLVLNRISGIQDIAFAQQLSGTSATLQLHASASDERQWGLTRMWSLSIPDLGIRAPVYLPSRTYWDAQKWELLEEQMQAGMQEGLVAYPHSVLPGKEGSLIIAGHSSPPNVRAEESNFGRIFERLPSIDNGSEILIEEGGTTFRYMVTETIIVSPEETSILSQQFDESILKLITCYPVGTTKDRLVVIAERVENE